MLNCYVAAFPFISMDATSPFTCPVTAIPQHTFLQMSAAECSVAAAMLGDLLAEGVSAGAAKRMVLGSIVSRRV